jgi:hypothetical protein
MSEAAIYTPQWTWAVSNCAHRPLKRYIRFVQLLVVVVLNSRISFLMCRKRRQREREFAVMRLGRRERIEKLRRLAILLSLLIPLAPAEVLGTEPQWLTLPPTPTLPQLEQSGTTPVNGIRLWYATFGPRRSSHPTAWRARQRELLGLSGPALQPRYRVIVVDSRGHGRSTRDQRPYGYDLMADDVLGLMDFLKIEKTAIVGWSDGAIVGLDIAMHIPSA